MNGNEIGKPGIWFLAILIISLACGMVLECSEKDDLPAAAPTEAASSTQEGDEGTATADQSTSGDEKVVALETEDVRIVMPARYIGKCTWSQDGECVMMTASNGQLMCTVAWGEGPRHEIEAKGDSYTIGEISHGSVDLTAYFFVLGVGSDGKGVYIGSSQQPDMTSTEYYLDLSPEEVVPWIELASSDGFIPAAIGSQVGTSGSTGSSTEATHDDASSGSTVSSSTAPFWGVWIGASKDGAEAEAQASQARAAGLDASVTYTTEWSNLNTEPWYVITACRADSKAEAQGIQDRAVQAGYSDAYVKYTGDHR